MFIKIREFFFEIDDYRVRFFWEGFCGKGVGVEVRILVVYSIWGVLWCGGRDVICICIRVVFEGIVLIFGFFFKVEI